MPPVLVSDLSRLRSWRLGSLVVLCAIVALLVAMATPSRADAARVRCAANFRVLNDDHVGALSLPRGDYAIAILSSGRPTCAQAAILFTRFLEDYDGKLPGGWRVNAGSSTFLRAPGIGFRVALSGGAGGGGSGGDGEVENGGSNGKHPIGASFCPAPFRVLHDDRIGPLSVPKGDYRIALLQRNGLRCTRAEILFARFLTAPRNHLPPPWLLEPQTASFLRSASGPGFRIKPAG
jgi:hypothetical protein